MSLRRCNRVWSFSLLGCALGGFSIANGQGKDNPQAANPQASQASAAPATQTPEAAESLRQRLRNRTGYFDERARTRLDEWIARNKISPLRAAEAAAAKDTAAAPNATVKTEGAAAAANVAGQRSVPRARFGYVAGAQPAAADSWFYDYYTYAPTYYASPAAGAALYTNASRYHDLDGDGIYDAVTVVREPGAKGVYDSYDRIDFVGAPNGVATAALADTVFHASRQTATGTIDRLKIVRVNGSDNLVVRVNTSINNPGTLVDLGPVDRWPSGTIKDGDVVTASGPVEDIGDRSVIIAETAKLNTSPEVQIRRFAAPYEGQIVDVMQAEAYGTQHTLAVLETATSRQVIDLGPTDRLKVALKPGQRVVVHGVLVRYQDYAVVLVDRVALDGQDIVIERWR